MCPQSSGPGEQFRQRPGAERKENASNTPEELDPRKNELERKAEICEAMLDNLHAKKFITAKEHGDWQKIIEEASDLLQKNQEASIDRAQADISYVLRRIKGVPTHNFIKVQDIKDAAKKQLTTARKFITILKNPNFKFSSKQPSGKVTAHIKAMRTTLKKAESMGLVSSNSPLTIGVEELSLTLNAALVRSNREEGPATLKGVREYCSSVRSADCYIYSEIDVYNKAKEFALGYTSEKDLPFVTKILKQSGITIIQKRKDVTSLVCRFGGNFTPSSFLALVQPLEGSLRYMEPRTRAPLNTNSG